MRTPTLLLIAVLAAPAIAGDEPAPEDVSELITTVRAKHDVPALAGAIVRLDGDPSPIAALGADGVRKLGDETKATAEDLWHIGSCGKAITATGIARLVDGGKLGWDTTLEKALPKLRESMHEDYRNVTIEQLLTHRSGLPGGLPQKRPKIWMALWGAKGELTARRAGVASALLAEEPESAPGTKYEYANAGYLIAAYVAEVVTETPWETLVQAEVLTPLKMTSAGFGPPGSPTNVLQPWAHRAVPKGLHPIPAGPMADNPQGFVPAGAIHLTLADWGRFVAAHLRGARGEGEFLKPQTWKALHEPPEGADYAKGWSVTKRGWAAGEGGSGVTLTHGGSNTMWYATVWAAPERGFAVLVVCNAGNAAAAKACDGVAGALIRHVATK